MPTRTTVTFRTQEIKRLAHEHARERVRKVFDEGAEMARTLCPVGPEHKDGTPHTKDTIRVIVEPDENLTLRADGAAAFINFGHHTRSGSFVPANPFFSQSVEYIRAKLLEALHGLYEK